MSDSSILIVGAGIIGCAVAQALAERGLRPIVLDPRLPGGGATQASAGMLAPYVEGHDSHALLDLGVRSLALYDDWIDAVARASGSEIEYRRIGTLEIALDPERATMLRGQASGVPGDRTWMPDDDAPPRYPAWGATAGALFTAAHGYVDARSLTTALVRAAERQGASFRQTAVRRIDADASAARVSTDEGELTARFVVLAAGAWGARLLGDDAASWLRPVRGQLVRLAWQGAPMETIVWGPDCYVVPKTDGSVLVGATVEEVGYDERTTAAGIRDLLDAACELLPEAGGATFLDARVGLRPATPDALPIVGPDARLPRVIHASGHFRNGV